MVAVMLAGRESHRRANRRYITTDAGREAKRAAWARWYAKNPDYRKDMK